MTPEFTRLFVKTMGFLSWAAVAYLTFHTTGEIREKFERLCSDDCPDISSDLTFLWLGAFIGWVLLPAALWMRSQRRK